MSVAPKPYHHGDLRTELLSSARRILDEEGLSALSLRAVARRAGVSHAAPYRHFDNHQALLVQLAVEGFNDLKGALQSLKSRRDHREDTIAKIGATYMRFVAQRPALARLMFGPQLPDRERYPELAGAADTIGEEIGLLLDDPAQGLAVWAAVHGLALLILENVVDLGQRRSGPDVLPSRAEILLRGLFAGSSE